MVREIPVRGNSPEVFPVPVHIVSKGWQLLFQVLSRLLVLKTALGYHPDPFH